MSLRKQLVLPVALLIAASTLSAFQAKPIDLTGTWTGTFTRSTGGDPGQAHIVLKQKGTEVTGTAGPGADNQVPIANGKVGPITASLTAEFRKRVSEDAPED